MKKLFSLLAVAAACFAGGRLSYQSTAIADGVGDGAPPCQDVNGDDQADISDAVYLLHWLFLGGPEPECPERNLQPVGLPDTGETLCYNESGSEVPCDGPVCPGQDSFYATGCPTQGRFVDNLDGTLTDLCTGLMWQKNTADINGDGEITPLDPDSGSPDALPWCEALAYCENLTFAGHDDWRLPNVRELQSIVDYGRSAPAAHPVFGTVSWAYWSSTSYTYDPVHAWVVGFNVGDAVAALRLFPLWIRAVRTAP